MHKDSELDIEELLAELKELRPDENYERLQNVLNQGYHLRDNFFDSAGIDSKVITKLQEAYEKDASTEELCALVAPELRKAFGIEVDSETSAKEEIKFKKSGENFLDDLGVTDEALGKFIALFLKCYNEDKDEDWKEFENFISPYWDKFLETSNREREEIGLIEKKGE